MKLLLLSILGSMLTFCQAQNGPTCEAPWPDPRTSRTYESCSCQRTNDGSYNVRCSSLTFWPSSTPSKTTQIHLDGTNMPRILNSSQLENLGRDLETLSCKSCGIEQVKGMTFFTLNKLKKLYLDDNSIMVLQRNAFLGLNNMDTLSLKNCGITSIQPDAFLQVYALNTLDLSNNDLSDIQIGAFKDLHSINQMIFNKMQATSLKPYSMNGLNRVNLMSFTHSKIQTIDRYAFYGLNNITTINFHSSDVKRLDKRAFVGIGQVTNIKFIDTKISTLECETLLNGLNCVRRINWDNIPLRCDCHMQWLIELSQNISSDLVRELKCASPYSLSGQIPMNLNRDALGCNQYETYMGCSRYDTRKPRVQPLERYLDEHMGDPNNSSLSPHDSNVVFILIAGLFLTLL